jgi:CRP-like cAMP-binding protein
MRKSYWQRILEQLKLADFVENEIKETMPSGRITKKSEKFPSDQITSGQNLLVDSLSPADQKFFLAHSTTIDLRLRQILLEPGAETEYCYFPTRGVLSIVAIMSSGEGAEVGLVGTEGMVGVGVLLGERRQPQQILVQGDGEAHRIASSDLVELCEKSEDAKALLMRYANGFLNFVAQGAACNALHKAEERLARWILLVQDRMQSDTLPITHEFIANMLGTRRATVTVVANQLEQAGLIRLGRREIRVIDRAALVLASCECYSIMTNATLSDS